jgi:hypothetical protein
MRERRLVQLYLRRDCLSLPESLFLARFYLPRIRNVAEIPRRGEAEISRPLFISELRPLPLPPSLPPSLLPSRSFSHLLRAFTAYCTRKMCNERRTTERRKPRLAISISMRLRFAED